MNVAVNGYSSSLKIAIAEISPLMLFNKPFSHSIKQFPFSKIAFFMESDSVNAKKKFSLIICSVKLC